MTGGPSRALVLGGGGVTGIAWELGVVDAWLQAGVDVRTADLAIGTSAGSAVVAQLWSGTPVPALVERQLDTATAERLPEMDLDAVIEIFMSAADAALTAEERGVRVGAQALAAPTVDEDVRRAIVAARLTGMDWADRPMQVTAVDAHTGELRLFEPGSGVDLVDAVAASCAVPGVWPPVTIDGRRYIDGGVRSPTNADLAIGHDRVLVLSPLASHLVPAVRDEMDGLRAAGTDARLFEADQQALEEMGVNPLDPAMRAPAVANGRRQGAAWAEELHAFWDG